MRLLMLNESRVMQEAKVAQCTLVQLVEWLYLHELLPVFIVVMLLQSLLIIEYGTAEFTFERTWLQHVRRIILQ